MSKNSDEKAHDGGGHDRCTSRDRNSTADIIADQLFGGSYNPPEGHKEAYDKGWVGTDNQIKK